MRLDTVTVDLVYFGLFMYLFYAFVLFAYSFFSVKVFTFLSKNLGNEWQQFILGLRGWPDPNRVNAIIDHKKEEEKHSVPNQIHGCLREWQKECPGFVTKENIIEALMRVELNELIESLPTEHVNDSASNGI